MRSVELFTGAGGLALGIAPSAAWIAVRGSLDGRIVVLTMNKKQLFVVADRQLSLYADLSAVANFTPIGTFDTPFTGTFDGQGHVIRNLTITMATGGGAGLFGFTAAGAIRLLGADIAGQLNCRGAQLTGTDTHGNSAIPLF